jgi:hypothetical protein
VIFDELSQGTFDVQPGKLIVFVATPDQFAA